MVLELLLCVIVFKMRCSVICVLVAIVTAVLANDRSKRNIPLHHLRISQKRSAADNVLLYEIPGYNDVLLKVTPKKILKKTSTPNYTNDADTNTSSQNKAYDETPSGFQKLVGMIKTGIHNKKLLLGKLFGPPTPINPIIIINEQTKPPAIQNTEKPLPHAVGMKYTETVEVDSKPMVVPMPTFIATPKQVSTEVLQPTYSYKQSSKDGTVMSYEFEDNPNVIVTETVAMPPLPSYIKSRFEEIVSAAVVPSMMRVSGAVISGDISFGPPIIPGNYGSVITPLPPIAGAVYPPAFARLQNMGYFDGGDLYGPPIFVEEDIPVLLRSTTNIFKMPGPKGDVNVKISKNRHPTFIHSKTSTKASPTNINLDSNINSGFISTPGRIHKAIPSPPALTINSKSISDVKKSSVQLPISQRSISNGNNDVTNNIVIINDQGSSFVHKQVSNKNMEPLDISKAAPDTNTYLGNKNGENDISNRMSNFYFVPPVKGNIEPLPINMQRTSNPTQESKQRSNQDVLRSCLDVSQATKSPLCPEPSRNDGFMKSSPIVIPDTSFVYKQINTDGSSINMLGSQNNVEVDIKDSKTTQDHRGDIP